MRVLYGADQFHIFVPVTVIDYMKSYTLYGVMATAFFILSVCYLMELMIIPGSVMLYLAMIFASVASNLKAKDCVKNDGIY